MMFIALYIFACIFDVYLLILIGKEMLRTTPVANLKVRFFNKSWTL